MTKPIRRIPLPEETTAAFRNYLIDRRARDDISLLGLAKLAGLKSSSRLTHVLTGKCQASSQIMLSVMDVLGDNFYTTLTDEGFLDLSLGKEDDDDYDDNDY